MIGRARSARTRKVTRLDTAELLPTALFGGVEGTFRWHNLSFDPATGRGSYILVMAPGASSMPHRHTGREEFYVISGELVDCDGLVYRAGDFVSLAPGTTHASLTTEGCTLLVVAWGRPERVSIGELEPMS
jgi:anti-sigma factor ChrR (cupin superfamily)